jgi:alpha-beta hydrolase superfamily lysophospholipase
VWRWSRLAIGAVLLVAGALIVGGGVDARRRLPDLKPWHRAHLDDVTASDLDATFTFAQYAAREERLFAEVRALEAAVADGDRTPVNRYYHGSLSHPNKAERDWNRSFETEAASSPRAGALLLHGLTDSPYSMRAIANVLRDRGVYSLSLRMPGHGTVPSGLVHATWEDWLAAVRVGVRHVRSRIPADAPLVLIGYSNGGALALKYSLEALGNGEPRPAKLILLSPMIGVTPAARLARWIGMLGFIPYFEKANWIDVIPEYNPFKYTSFPANAGFQTFRLTRAIHEDLDRVHASGRASELPPILTFQSIVDTTVSAPAVVFMLYERLPANGSELVLFDVNHLSGIDVFVQPSDREVGARFLIAEARPYRRVLVTNASAATRDVEARTVEPGQTHTAHSALGLSWPEDVFSLTHIAVPFPVDDPLYGIAPAAAPSGALALGRLSPRGERSVLTVGTDVLMRLSSNPFFPFVAQRINRWLALGSP